METYVFVCSGNIIRSAFAHLYALHLGIINVDSFGTTYHNETIHPKTKTELLKIGVDKETIDNFKPKHISKFKSPPNPIFLVMTEKHRKQLIQKGINPSKISKITQLIGNTNDIRDPYWTRRFKHAFQTIKKCVQALAEQKGLSQRNHPKP